MIIWCIMFLFPGGLIISAKLAHMYQVRAAERNGKKYMYLHESGFDMCLQIMHPSANQRGYWLKLAPIAISAPGVTSTLGGDAGNCNANACSGELLT